MAFSKSDPGVRTLSMGVSGTLGRYGYANLPEDMTDEIIEIATKHAYSVAVKNAPYDPEPDGVNIRNDLKYWFSKMAHEGMVFIKSIYAHIAEYGSKKRFEHPYMRPAIRAARSKVKAMGRRAMKKAIEEEKAKAK